MSLRSLIEGKARRKVTHPILVGDAAAAEAEVATFRAVLDTHLQMLAGRRVNGAEGVGPADDEQTAKLRQNLADAKARLAATVVMVELQALEPAEWDALCDQLPEEPDGGYDVTGIRAELMAACCIDPELQDPEWWAEQFARPEWSKGDLVSINYMLIGLNLSTPAGAAGKG